MKNKRWRLVLRVFAAWLIGLYIFWLAVPIQPRFRFVAGVEQRLVGITDNSRMLITAGAASEASSAVRGPLRRWDLQTGQEEQFALAQSSDHWIGGLLLAPGNQAAAYECSRMDGSDASVRLLSLRTGRELLCLRDCYARDSFFSPDGAWFGVTREEISGTSNALRIFQSASGQEMLLTDAAHIMAKVKGVGFSADSRLLAYSAWMQGAWHTQVWDLHERRVTADVAGCFRVLVFAPDNTSLAAAGSDGGLRLVNLATGQAEHLAKDADVDCDPLAFTPDGQTLVACQMQRSTQHITSWDTRTGKVIRRLAPPPSQGSWTNLLGPTNPLLTVVQHEDKNWKLLDVASGESLGAWPQADELLQLSANGKFLITTGFRQNKPDRLRGRVQQWLPGFAQGKTLHSDLQLWDATTHRVLLRLDDYDSDCLFAPDSQTLITQKEPGGVIEVWDVPPRKPLRPILEWSGLFPLATLLIGSWLRARRERKSQGRARLTITSDNQASRKAEDTAYPRVDHHQE